VRSRLAAVDVLDYNLGIGTVELPQLMNVINQIVGRVADRDARFGVQKKRPRIHLIRSVIDEA